MKKIKIIIFISFSLFVILFVLFQKKSSKPNKPNIILIQVDALRADHLGCYGYKRNTSPNIDEFAKGATLYKNALSQAPSTMPSNYSLLTSLYSRQHKMINWDSLLDPSIPNILSILYNNGYSIGIFGSHPLFLRNIKENFMDLLEDFGDLQRSSFIFEKATKWIKFGRPPFFLWAYYVNPHRPYRPPAPHDKLFSFEAGPHLPIKSIEKDYSGGWDYIPDFIVDHGIDNPNYYVAQYDGEIHYADEEIGKLFRWLKAEGLFTQSLIIVTADHGESLGEHRLFFNHLYTLFDEIIKVPLIIKWPGQRSGEVVQENVALVDILPTILEATGIHSRNTVEGVSLCKGAPKERMIFSCGKKMTALVSGNWKLINYDKRMNNENEYVRLFFPNYPKGNYQLFNVENDPDEKIDLVSRNKDVYEKMKLDLLEYETRMSKFVPKVNKFKLDQVIRNELKALGYLQ